MTQPSLPRITRVGLSGLLVSFSDRLSDPANRAALALRAAVEDACWPGVTETAPTLAALFVRVDPAAADPAEIEDRLGDLLRSRDWEAAPLPSGRKLWTIPCAFGGEEGPQLAEAAKLAGCTPDEAIDQICAAPLRVLTIGFAPGQPYTGTLEPNWDIPRQTELTKTVPVGAVVVAVRQVIIFTVASPTGWRQIGRSGFRGFQPEAPTPVLLTAGDEIRLQAVTADTLDSAETIWEPLT